MKTKLPAQSVIFNSGFLISLSVSVFAVFLLALGEFAMGNPSGLGRCVLERVCSIKPGKPNVKGRTTGKTQIRLRRNPFFSGRICRALWVGNV